VAARFGEVLSVDVAAGDDDADAFDLVVGDQ
jgi:hypothetical protein